MDSVFYWLSKLIWIVISPDSLLLLMIFGSLIMLWVGAIQLATRMLAFVAFSSLLIAIFPVGEWVLYPLESSYDSNPTLPADIEGVILLGGAGDQRKSLQWQQVEFNDAAERYVAFLDLARSFPNARLVFTGGAGAIRQQAFKEATLARRFFADQGLSPERIMFEDQSRNTYENAILSKGLVNPTDGDHWVLITSASHMPRSLGVFCKAGWPVIPYPVDHVSNPDYLLRADLAFAEHLENLKDGMKEWIGLIAYRVTGKTAQFWGQCI